MIKLWMGVVRAFLEKLEPECCNRHEVVYSVGVLR